MIFGEKAVQEEAILRTRLEGVVDPGITIGALERKYIEHLLTVRKASSKISYESIWKNHLEKAFCDKKLDGLSLIDIEKWKKTMDQKNLSLHFKQKCFAELKRIVGWGFKEYGVRCQAMERATNFTGDPNAVPEEKPLHFWNAKQCSDFLEAMGEEIDNSEKETGRPAMILKEIRVYMAVMMYAGLRKGEANALLVSDFHDGDHPFLRVTKSVNEKIKGIPYLVTSPKNSSSVRDVPIPATLADMLRTHISLLRKIPNFTDSFFLYGGPTPVADSTATKIKQDIEKKAGIPHIRIHDLRHTYVSILINAGINATTIASLVGHSTPEITMKVYSHIFPKTKNDTIDMLEEIIAKGNKQ